MKRDLCIWKETYNNEVAIDISKDTRRQKRCQLWGTPLTCQQKPRTWKETYFIWKETYFIWKETYFTWKETYFTWKETYFIWKETNFIWQETWEETCVCGRRPVKTWLLWICQKTPGAYQGIPTLRWNVYSDLVITGLFPYTQVSFHMK